MRRASSVALLAAGRNPSGRGGADEGRSGPFAASGTAHVSDINYTDRGELALAVCLSTLLSIQPTFDRARAVIGRLARRRSSSVIAITTSHHFASAAKLPVVHTIKLLDWAYGGPTPEGIPEQRLVAAE